MCLNQSFAKTAMATEKTNSVQVNPKAGSLTIDIVPFNGTPKEMVQGLFVRLKQIFPNITLQNPIPFPANAWYAPRTRYKADSLISFLSENAQRRHVSLGITTDDISTTNGDIADWGIMGLGFMPGNACIISSFRLNKGNLPDQLFKVAIHELGHTQGLDHCPNKSCFMRDAEGKNTTDQEIEFCPKCKAFLISKGWVIK